MNGEQFQAHKLGRNYWRVFDNLSGLDVATFMGPDAESRAKSRADQENSK